jgi:nucleotide-binding universal stress UspA family protein
MTYRTLLLQLNDHPRSAACTDYAARLARRFEARLVGLSAHWPVPWPSDGAVAFLAGDPLTGQLREAEQHASARESEFERQCGLAGLTSFEIHRDDDTDPAAAVVSHALGADLVVLGQPDPQERAYRARRTLVDTVLQECARPVLVLPYAGALEPDVGTVLVAWDGSAEAARAAAAALPLIERARAVHLLHLRRPEQDDEAILQAGVNRAAAWLSCHGVQVRGRVSTNTLPVGEALLSELADIGAELLVMGAWGRRPLVERLLGGATRTLVDSMTVPVLFAH